MLFEQLSVAAPILKALADQGYSNPTPIQEQSIPVILEQKDILGCARTGTGKTAAFAIPIIQLLAEEKEKAPVKGIRALILTPTRELALQIQESFDAYGKYTNLRQVVIFGGVSQHAQVQELRRGCDVLVATPGRLLDLMQQGIINIGQIRILVLDEADRMLDMGFIHDVKKVLAKTPAQKQTLFFSATMAPEIKKLSDSILKNPVHVTVTPVASTAETVGQTLYYVDKKNKNPLLVHILQDPSITASIVFSRTKHGANKIAKALENAGIRSEAIHGNKSQAARQRALQLLKDRQIRVLVATDIAARGIDVEELSHVINYDLPNIPESYVHRIGRTGRAGASGLAISFCDQEEREFLRDIQRLIKKNVPVIEDHPFKPGSPIVKEPVVQAPAIAKHQAGSRPVQSEGGHSGNRKNRNRNQRNGQQSEGSQGQQNRPFQREGNQQGNRNGQQQSARPVQKQNGHQQLQPAQQRNSNQQAAQQKSNTARPAQGQQPQRLQVQKLAATQQQKQLAKTNQPQQAAHFVQKNETPQSGSKFIPNKKPVQPEQPKEQHPNFQSNIKYPTYDDEVDRW
ncbi:MAG: DEAD/DEAH box helicase [Pseudobacter sp.]|uniref:DEAD/DEAH box helicase n=1 Tax=Pseudobacter sp. TaxID=2045420 RepID=UPI003F7E8D08